MFTKKNLHSPIILLLLGFLVHFFFLGHPREVVFDEVHFAGFSSRYFTGQYYFDNHPPLGKLIVALGAKIGGYAHYVEKYGNFDFSSIGNAYGQVPIFWFRFFPALAGALLPWVLFLFLRSIKASDSVAFFAGLFVVLENSLLVQSRFVLMDIFMILFGFLGLLSFFRARSLGYKPLLIVVAGLFLGASFSAKWFGISYLAVASFVIGWDFLQALGRIIFSRKKINEKEAETENNWGKISKEIFPTAVFLFSMASLFYVGVFFVHFALLPNFTPSDVPRGEKPFVEKFVELNQQMYYSHSGLVATHPDESSPLQWLTLKKPVHYWSKSAGASFSQVTFFGNPIIWICGMLGVFCFPFFWRKIKLKPEIKGALFFGFWINFLPFLFIDRLLFLYHYLNALVFSVILFGLVFFALEKNKKLFFGLMLPLVFLVLISFFLFSNYSYGLPFPEGWQKRITSFFMY